MVPARVPRNPAPPFRLWPRYRCVPLDDRFCVLLGSRFAAGSTPGGGANGRGTAVPAQTPRSWRLPPARHHEYLPEAGTV